MREERDPRGLYLSDGRRIHGARIVAPGDTPEDFLRWAYDGAGENPLAWRASASDLLDAATAVKANVQPIDGGMMHTLAAVQAMLLGLALECLLKGAYIKLYRVWNEPDKAHAIVKDGKYVGVPGAGDHQLLQLATAAKVTLNQAETAALTRLTNFVLYAGRYPVPTRVENMKPTKTAAGGTVARSYISAKELERGEGLARRLMMEVQPW